MMFSLFNKSSDSPADKVIRGVEQLLKKHEELYQESRFKDYLLHDSGILVYVVGVNGHSDFKNNQIMWMNDEAMKLFGNRIGGMCYEVLHDSPTQCEHCNRSSLEKPGTVVRWAMYNRKLSKVFSMADMVVEEDGRKFRIVSANDVTHLISELDTIKTQLHGSGDEINT